MFGVRAVWHRLSPWCVAVPPLLVAAVALLRGRGLYALYLEGLAAACGLYVWHQLSRSGKGGLGRWVRNPVERARHPILYWLDVAVMGVFYCVLVVAGVI